MSEPRSRKTFRFMPAPVVEHNRVSDRALSPSYAPSASFGRGLYGKKLALADADKAGASESGRDADQQALSALPFTLLRWQLPLRYLIVWQRRDFTLTWHAPWCRDCDCAGAGWHFGRDVGYLSGLGFELSFAQG